MVPRVKHEKLVVSLELLVTLTNKQLDWHSNVYKMIIIYNSPTWHMDVWFWCYSKLAIFCCQFEMKMISFLVYLQMFCNNFKLLVNEVP